MDCSFFPAIPQIRTKTPPPPDGENENVVESVVVSADKQRVIGTGIDIQLTAVARNAQGDAVPGVDFVWTTANPEIATVDESGEAVTTGLGKVRIEAETAGITGSIEIEALPSWDSTTFSEYALPGVASRWVCCSTRFNGTGCIGRSCHGPLRFHGRAAIPM